MFMKTQVAFGLKQAGGAAPAYAQPIPMPPPARVQISSIRKLIIGPLSAQIERALQADDGRFIGHTSPPGGIIQIVGLSVVHRVRPRRRRKPRLTLAWGPKPNRLQSNYPLRTCRSAPRSTRSPGFSSLPFNASRLRSTPSCAAKCRRRSVCRHPARSNGGERLGAQRGAQQGVELRLARQSRMGGFVTASPNVRLPMD
jgi:hypothetical protein